MARRAARRDDRRPRRDAERDSPRRERVPEPALPEDITGRELAGAVRSQLRPLDKDNAETVSKHLVAAGRLLDVDPEAAYAHARFAVSRAGRVGAVREAMGLVAYQLEKYDEAVRELRTHRRITGSTDNLALLADAERGRGRPAKALELIAEVDAADVPPELWTELMIVAAGAHTDAGDIRAARALLEEQSFTGSASGATVRLMSAYADILRIDGEPETADKYEELARRTARATNTFFGDEEPDPNAGVEIITIEEIEEIEDEPEDGEPEQAGSEEAGPEDPGSEEAGSEEAAAEPMGGGDLAAAPQSFRDEIEAEVDEILAEAGIGADDVEPESASAPGVAPERESAAEPASEPEPVSVVEPESTDEPAPEPAPEPESTGASAGASEPEDTEDEKDDEKDEQRRRRDEDDEMTAPLFDL